jgi:LmbE family N-acetylglucosaminyl deacetylase
METKPLRILVIGAHPDDCEYSAGGITCLWTRLGHIVKTVSLTNGDAGHIDTAGAHLARRRTAEAAAAAKVMGAESLVLNNHDGELMPTLELRMQVIRIIREFGADLVLTHRTNDYHPDHRYTGVVVQDAINMVIVSNLVPQTPSVRMPVMMYLWDHFKKPYPFIPDVIVDIDDVYEQKLEALHCHTSQMYEFIFGKTDDIPLEKRRDWLKEKVEPEMTAPAKQYREKLRELCGSEKGDQVRYIEAFEISEYGAPLTDERREKLFPFRMK